MLFCSKSIRKTYFLKGKAYLLLYFLNIRRGRFILVEKVHNSSTQFSHFLTENDLIVLHRIVSEKNNVLITGERAGGKTLFLKQLIRMIPNDENVLLFDFFSEVQIPERNGSTFLVGYKDNADIKGNFGKEELKRMIDTSLLLPFDRMVVDELYGDELKTLFLSLHKGRCGYFVVPGSNGENALKMMFLNTIYPENKTLQPQHMNEIKDVFQYVITVGKSIAIEKISMSGNSIHFEKIN